MRTWNTDELKKNVWPFRTISPVLLLLPLVLAHAVCGHHTLGASFPLLLTLSLPPGGGGSPEMIEQWIQLVHEKNELVSEESDLMVA